MGAPRKHPPANFKELIEQYVAGEGGSTHILARIIGVAQSTVARWFERDEELKELYESAREAYMHKLYLELIQMSRAGKGNVAGIIFTLKAKFKQYDLPASGKVVDVNVNNVQPVMVVIDHGTDQEWSEKVAAQQRALTSGTPALPKSNVDVPALADGANDEEFIVPAYSEVLAPPTRIEAPSWRGNA